MQSQDSAVSGTGRLRFFADANYDAVVVGASLGGLEVLSTIVRALPGGFAAPLLVVQHISPHRPSLLSEILARGSALRVKEAQDGERLRAATVYVAAPDRHLQLQDDGTLSLSSGSRMNHVRPAADMLFHSAARVLGPRALGVVLTGLLHDGATGVSDIRAVGGVVIAQDPLTCLAPEMPQAAMATGAVHFVLPPEMIAHALVGLVMKPGLPALFGIARWSQAA